MKAYQKPISVNQCNKNNHTKFHPDMIWLHVAQQR